MEAQEFDFEFPRGDTCPIQFTVKTKDGQDVDLAQATEIYFTVKKNYNTSTAILQKKKSTGDITIDGSQGKIFLTHNDTKELSYGAYVYDIQITSGDYVKTVVLGTITLTNESTHYANE